MTPGALLDEAHRWLVAGHRAVDVQVLAARGSTPRPAGTRMLVGSDALLGTIGGGHLELQALRAARAWLQQGGPVDNHEVRDLELPLGPALGQCCGGHVTLRMQALSARSLVSWPRPRPRFFLQLHGAGHVGRAVIKLLADIDCVVQWVDEREDEFPPLTGQEPTHIRRLCVDTPEAEVPLAPPGAAYLVMTHRHDLDERITEAILRRGDFSYCGLIGSQTKRAKFEHRLGARGLAPELLARMTCPVGLAGIEGKEPAVVAVGVVGQLLGLPSQSTYRATPVATSTNS